ncbi:MAG TPA: SpoIIE family protein phosphatase [Planctomicrobium sp.]|nr:SpoIIE family protein phosphatase [Planctomicrobium sp.]
MPTLIVFGQPSPGNQKRIQKQRHLVVGRDPTCDLVIPRQAISRFHAQVIASRDSFYLEDMGSTNGTFLNGRRLAKREPLSDGDRITLHDVSIGFFLADQVDENQLNGNGYTASTFPDQPDELRISPPAESLSPIVSPGPGVVNLKGQLTSLIEITRHLGSSLQLEEILPRVLDLLFRSFTQAVWGEIHLVDPDGHLRPVAMKHGRDADSTDLTGAPLNLELIQKVIASGRGVIAKEESNDSGLALDEFDQCTICVPILGAESIPCGVILLQSNGAPCGFSEDDLDLVSAVGVIAGQSIGYARAHDVVLQHNESERQLETARHVQLSMLPRESPQVEGYDFFHEYCAAQKVGGDYFFYEKMRDGRVIFGIADASGKGLPAAMNIMRFAGEVKLRIATAPTLKSAVSRLNQFILEGAEECMFITACIGVLDPEKHLLTFANAGHPPPLLKRRGNSQVAEIVQSSRSFPFGISEALEVHPIHFQIEPGDQVLLYTDGVSEAMNPRNELFGMERLSESLMNSSGGVQQSIEDLVKDVTRFREGRANNDDMAIVGFECLRGRPETVST